ncbi:zinc finger CCCH domain-containing protein 33 [Cocos nucifera]|uniref:Zinc finger CCCH domain-containing protein 33 n=1 Tax=Cocos nucifera TaxID=13894 RepID=A0A8K0I740_COCNU|nr:zinc finger CCCH domain-containing protein 33 [Cocos nucifera]
MGAGGDPEKLSAAVSPASLLLELSASDDLPAFKRAVEDDGLPLDCPAPWYCRSPNRRTMGFEQRTPLMIAALYGSPAVLAYILSARPAEASRRSPSDGATPLHCAASGGSPFSVGIVKMLMDAAADVDATDAAGNRPGDVIARHFSASTTRSLEVVLKASCPGVSSPGGAKEEETKSGEKKYPLDITLPDINNGIYGTDEFRMYTFKVKPCSRAYSHDWTECPFVHPGENARRRDPRKYFYSCVPCPEFRKGSCRNGDACEYAHGVFESWLHPDQYRTRLCKDETGCNRRVCFFAHKPEELRSVIPSAASVAGMVLSSPKSSSSGLSSLDMATALLMMQQTGSGMSPSASSGLGAATAWMNQPGSLATPPSLQLPSSRLKASRSARDLSFDLDLLGLEGYQQKLIDEISSTASPRANWTPNSLAAASRASDINELFGSLNPAMLSQLQGLSLKKTAAASSSAGGQFQSPTGVRPQLLSGYGGNLPPPSPTVSGTSSFGLDHSMAKAIMSSRASAFAKRSQSFIDRGATAGRQSTLSSMTSAAAAAAPVLSDWGSPDGKLDWGIQGDELNKLRKSASFNFRTNQAGSGFGGAAPAAAAVPGGLDEPDLSWVQSLVKDGPAAPMGRHGLEQQHKGYQLNGAGGDFHGSELLSSWEEKIMA